MYRKKLLTLCLLPIALLILEISLLSMGMHYSGHGSWVMSGWNWIGILAGYGLYFLPFICLFPEIIGLVIAVKRKSTLFRVIYIAELLLTLTACPLSIFLFFQSLQTKSC